MNPRLNIAGLRVIRLAGALLGLLVPGGVGFAQTPPPAASRLPPAGIQISDTDGRDLASGALALREAIDVAAHELASRPQLLARLPDAEVFHKAVDWALRYDEFFDARQVAYARSLLEQGLERAKQLRNGQSPWLSANGLVVRGYRSKLDGSVQPYGLVVPPTWKSNDGKARRLNVWLAGRNEKRTELAFIAEREKSGGPFTPEDTIVLHPYGRFCNATKFAGEVDVFEAMDAVRRDYLIDSNRIIVAGFSMGGASAWHLSTHHAGLWGASSPGAGFAETAVYTKALAAGKEPPPWWEQKLWRWYDATACAGNLFNCPTIAYSGEIDPQKQSAEIMEQAMAAEGLKLELLIGPQTAHKYHPDTQKELAARLDALAAKGRDPSPKEVRLSTYTLQYPELAWVRVEGLARHWERADVRARRDEAGAVTVATTNVSALRLSLDGIRAVTIDGQSLSPSKRAALSGLAFQKREGRWAIGAPTRALRKQPGLTGPIDDAFMSAFLFVRPTGKPYSEGFGTWTQAELAHATKMWRDIFRGDAPMKDDSMVNEADIAAKNLVLWGDPSSNRLLEKMIRRLPLRWDAHQLVFNGQTYDVAQHAPILIFPNPLNPRRYVVLNSGMDFRNDAYGSNARQTPKLPDWAIIDLNTPPGPRWPGRIADAGFFDEQWRLVANFQ